MSVVGQVFRYSVPLTDSCHRWFVKVSRHGKKHECGSFDSAEDAARAADLKAVQLGFGAHHLNFPNEYERLRSVDDGSCDVDEMDPVNRGSHQHQSLRSTLAKSGYQNVYSNGTVYFARLQVGDKTYPLNPFATAIDAARAADRKRLTLGMEKEKLTFAEEYDWRSCGCAVGFPHRQSCTECMLTAATGGGVDEGLVFADGNAGGVEAAAPSRLSLRAPKPNVRLQPFPSCGLARPVQTNASEPHDEANRHFSHHCECPCIEFASRLNGRAAFATAPLTVPGSHTKNTCGFCLFNVNCGA